MSDKPTSPLSRKLGKSTTAAPQTEKSAPAPKTRKKRAPKKELPTLEYEIVGKIATTKVQDKTISFKKWGLSKRLQLGARVALLIDRVRPFLSEGEDVSEDTQMILAILGQLSSDIIYVVVESTVNTFDSHDEGVEWVEDNCEPQDLFLLGRIVYDMNLKGGEQLGKLTQGMTKLAESLNNLLKE